MTELFEAHPTTNMFINMVVPDGEPCGCYENRGCLDSMYCSCECKCCLVQRLVDASRICYTCRKNHAAHWIEYEDINGDDVINKICNDCHQKDLIFKGLLEPIDEDCDTEEDEQLCIRDEEDGDEDDSDADRDRDSDGGSIDSETREYLWERYWYNMENCADD
jgi:hypothetical protein